MDPPEEELAALLSEYIGNFVTNRMEEALRAFDAWLKSVIKKMLIHVIKRVLSPIYNAMKKLRHPFFHK